MSTRPASLRRLLAANFTPPFRPAYLVVTMMACSATSAMAQMTLTQAGIDRFGPNALTTFASNFPTTSDVGPRGIDYLPSGQVLVSSLNGQVRSFPNRDAMGNRIDNQSAPIVTPFVTIAGNNNANGMGHIGADTSIYLAQTGNNRVIRMNADGSNQVPIATIPSALGIAVHPSNGHLFVTGSGGGMGGVFNVDPMTGTVTTISTEPADGITITPNGSTIYVANYGGTSPSQIVGYNTLTNAEVFRSVQIPGNIDGVALGFGPLMGYIYAITNGNGTNTGTIVEVNLNMPTAFSVIASGGRRGDLCASDPTGSGDVLFTQSMSVIRLRGVPAPSSVALLGLGGLLAARRRR